MKQLLIFLCSTECKFVYGVQRSEGMVERMERATINILEGECKKDITKYKSIIIIGPANPK